MIDNRNLVDEFKGKSEASIIAQLDSQCVALHIAVENLSRDYNMGTIVRSANAFGVRHVHVIGRRQWNKRGAMATDKYLHVHYHENIEIFVDAMSELHKAIVAIDNVPGSTDLSKANLPENAVFVFGSEGAGLSPELLSRAESIIAIEQFGSTRSINVGVAAGVAMYEWARRHRLT